MPEAAAPSRLLRRRTRTRAALIDAARQVFAADGLQGATIQRITDTADVAKGSFYNHFESREDILHAVVADTFDALGRTLDESVAAQLSDPARVIACSLLATVRACVGDPVLGRFVLESTRLHDVADVAIGARGRRDLARGQASGRFDFEDTEDALALLAGGAEALLQRRLRGDADEASEPRFLALALRALGLEKIEADAIAQEAAEASSNQEPLR